MCGRRRRRARRAKRKRRRRRRRKQLRRPRQVRPRRQPRMRQRRLRPRTPRRRPPMRRSPPRPRTASCGERARPQQRGRGIALRNPGQGMHQSDMQLPARRCAGQLCSGGSVARRWSQLERPVSRVPCFRHAARSGRSGVLRGVPCLLIAGLQVLPSQWTVGRRCMVPGRLAPGAAVCCLADCARPCIGCQQRALPGRPSG